MSKTSGRIAIRGIMDSVDQRYKHEAVAFGTIHSFLQWGDEAPGSRFTR
jgi:hypothetical protein